MEYQRRILGFLYTIGGACIIFIMSIASALMFAVPVDFFEPNAVPLPAFVKLISLLTSLFLLIILGIPSVVVGIGLLKKKHWAFDWILAVGCFYLLFFPIGTAIGIYGLVVFFGNRAYQTDEQISIHGQEKVVQ
jgi:hypothetical protein